MSQLDGLLQIVKRDNIQVKKKKKKGKKKKVRTSDSIITAYRKAFTSGLGLYALPLAWPAVVQIVVFFDSGSQWV